MPRVVAKRDNLDFHLAYIPETFLVESEEPFDPEYMRELYNLGYGMAREGYPWSPTPPDYTGPD